MIIFRTINIVLALQYQLKTKNTSTLGLITNYLHTKHIFKRYNSRKWKRIETRTVVTVAHRHQSYDWDIRLLIIQFELFWYYVLWIKNVYKKMRFFRWTKLISFFFFFFGLNLNEITNGLKALQLFSIFRRWKMPHHIKILNMNLRSGVQIFLSQISVQIAIHSFRKWISTWSRFILTCRNCCFLFKWI